MSHTNTFPCEMKGCEKRFRSQERLEVHLRRHRGEDPFMCTECDEGFKKLIELREHMQKHTGKASFPLRSFG